MQIISIINNKGGVGKTTSSQNIASGLARRGQKVGLVDFDSQANLTSALKVKDYILDLRTALIEKKEVGFDQFAETETENLRILPNRGDTTSKIFSEFEAFEQTLALKNILPKKGFDFLIIDTPPNLDIQTYNAVVASDHVLIPVEYDVFSIQGLSKIFERIEQINKGGFTKAKILGIFITQVDNRQSLNKITQSKLERDFKNHLLNSYIRVNSEFRKAQALRSNIWEYGDRKGSFDYDQLIDEILSKIN